MPLVRQTTLLLGLALAGCGGGGTTDPPGNNNGNNGNNGNQTLGSITTSVQSLTMGAGTTQTITVAAFNTANQSISFTSGLSFTSSNPAIAEVDQTGQVLAISAGPAQIRVALTLGSVTKDVTIPVIVSGSLAGSADVVASSTDYIFSPRTVVISRNGAVTWNFGSLEHTVTFASAPGAPTSINTGGYLTTHSRTFPTAGNFLYTCTLHAGMSGTVVVR
jgi:plastocyanin